MGVAAGLDSLRERVGALPWYHTIDLGRGVVTRGMVDTRGCVDRIPFPPVEGCRCLDVGTQNGFWAFELERRGATEVIAVDLPDKAVRDFPRGVRAVRSPDDSPEEGGVARRGFELAKEALGSQVAWRGRSVYDLSADDLGTFDVVFVGSLLLHLRDPIGALERIRAVCRGELVVFDVIDPIRTLVSRRPSALLDGRRVWWWTPNWPGLRRMIESAGFAIAERGSLVFVPPGEGWKPPSWREAASSGLLGLLAAKKGSPQIGVRARPRGQ